MPGVGGRNPVGICSRCGAALGFMGLCDRCACEDRERVRRERERELMRFEAHFTRELNPYPAIEQFESRLPWDPPGRKGRY